MNKRIYISGKITGIEKQAPELFSNAAHQLKSAGYTVLNPMTLLHNHDLTWESYMKVDIRAMLTCDEVYMLSNWTDSKGAKIEHAIALMLGLKIKYETDLHANQAYLVQNEIEELLKVNIVDFFL